MVERTVDRAYPLAALRELKDAEESARTTELARRTAAEAERLLAHRTAIERRELHAAETARIERDEAARDAPRSAGELALHAAWRMARRSEHHTLGAAVDEARRALEVAANETEVARTSLAAARAEVEALVRHRERWDAERRLTTERRAEAESEDVVAGNLHRRS